jgi:26S proteasome regulatory subunit N13
MAASSSSSSTPAPSDISSGSSPSHSTPKATPAGLASDILLNGEEVDVQAELAGVQSTSGGDEDETMEDVEGTDHSANRNRHGSTGGAGAGATGGDVREEGSSSRDAGADGGRA